MMDEDGTQETSTLQIKKPRFSKELGTRLYDLRTSGNCVDMAFELTSSNGEEPVKFMVHKNVLIAMSTYWETCMADRWAHHGAVEIITVPAKVGVDALDAFIKYLYTEELNEDLTCATLLEILFLADHYLVNSLRRVCDEFLVGKVCIANCVDIYQYTSLLVELKTTVRAFECIVQDIEQVWQATQANKWESQTWKAILSLNYLKSTSELNLFKKLIKWKNSRPAEKTEDFLKLISLIRFPLMSTEAFSEFVVPTGVIRDKDIVELFVYFSGKGGSSKFCTEPRNKLKPRNGTQLIEALEKVDKGDRIQLCGKLYEGTFHLKQNEVTLEGIANSKSILKSVSATSLEISGSHCTISGIAVDCISVGKKSYGIMIIGNYNKVMDISVGGGSVGICIEGQGNTLASVSVGRCLSYPLCSELRVPNNNMEVCGCGRLLVNGRNNELLKVNGGKLIKIVGTGYYLNNCVADKFLHFSSCPNLSVVNCKFSLIVDGDDYT